LEWRGLVYDATDGARDVLARNRVTGYIGFDPTASSLHVGSLLVIMALARMQRLGHSPIAIVGGGTGLIGDPSGKSAERTLLTTEQVEANVEALRTQLARFLDFDTTANPARLVNNAEWLTKISAVELLRDVGKYFTVNYMLAKESVKRRIESEDGISFTEFSYLLLQSYDFVMLYDRFACTLQMGGSDQWGNITAGVDLVRKLRGAKVHGLVMPLVTTASGTKFGKTEAGTVWLDPALTKPFEFLQFWMKTDDRDVGRYLRFFTFLPQDRIRELEDATARAPEQREAQRELAREVTRLVHGDAAVRDAEAATAKLFSGDVSTMSVSELLEVFPNVPSSDAAYVAEGWPVVELLSSSGVTASKSEATRLIRGGGLYINNRRITDEKARVSPEHAIEGQLFVIRKGKKENFLIRIQPGVPKRDRDGGRG
jgi:tyrosyl-tRNA synthetase